jgi:hypothetical protein
VANLLFNDHFQGVDERREECGVGETRLACGIYYNYINKTSRVNSLQMQAIHLSNLIVVTLPLNNTKPKND